MKIEDILSEVQPPEHPPQQEEGAAPSPTTFCRMVEVESIKNERQWTFHYSDGTTFRTKDAEVAEMMSRAAFPVIRK